MKKIIVLLFVIVALTACGGNDGKEAKEEKKEDASDITKNPDYQKALAIVAKSDCLTCHKIDEKNIGPAWRDVANKYAGQDTAIKYLSHKIITGGSGVWGEVPMAAHPTITQEDAETLAKYVLLLKK
jgi:cytochrome c